jgi:hypothetical protein
MSDAGEGVLEQIAHCPASERGEVWLQDALILAFIPDQPLTLSFNLAEVDRRTVATLVSLLRQIPFEARGTFEPAMWTFYCQEMKDGAGNFATPQEQLDWEADLNKRRTFPNPVHATKPAEVWPLVKFTRLIVSRWPSDSPHYAILGGTAAWDGEHGITFRFDDRAELVAVDHW